MKEKKEYNVGQVQSDVHTKKLHTYRIISIQIFVKILHSSIGLEKEMPA